MSTCPTSNQGHTRADLEDGELQKMLALPLYAYFEEKITVLLRDP